MSVATQYLESLRLLEDSSWTLDEIFWRGVSPGPGQRPSAIRDLSGKIGFDPHRDRSSPPPPPVQRSAIEDLPQHVGFNPHRNNPPYVHTEPLVDIRDVGLAHARGHFNTVGYPGSGVEQTGFAAQRGTRPVPRSRTPVPVGRHFSTPFEDGIIHEPSAHSPHISPHNAFVSTSYDPKEDVYVPSAIEVLPHVIGGYNPHRSRHEMLDKGKYSRSLLVRHGIFELYQ